MSIKKTILPEEWEIIKEEAKDPACCLSRLYERLRNNRAEKGVELMNRSWFMAFLMNVCGAKDGKIGSKFRIPPQQKTGRSQRNGRYACKRH